MFTLKFYSLDHAGDPAREVMTAVSAPRYDVLKYSEGNYSIAVYSKTTPGDEEGTEFRVSSEKRDYANCYIENMSGKTIDHYESVYEEPLTTAAV